MDDSQIMDNSQLLLNFEADQRAPKKKLVVPMNYQDKWLAYLLENLNKANDLIWVNELLSKIEENKQEFNAGKFRGAVFQLNYIEREGLKSKMAMTISSRRATSPNFNSRDSHFSSKSDVRQSQNMGRVFASQTLVDSMAFHQKLGDSINVELIKQMNDEAIEDESPNL